MRWRRWLVALLGLAPALVAAQPFALQPLHGADGALLQALERGPLAPPVRLRVVVIPGSGCAGMGAIADRYFAGLLQARVLVLHKRGVAADAITSADECSADFLRQDAHSVWLADAQAALGAWLAQQEKADHAAREAVPPLVLVGISEGAELLPRLAAQVHPAALVLIASSGLDPADAGRLQAQRLGALGAWTRLEREQAGPQPDDVIAEGRSLRYWRDLWHWPLAQPLLQGPWPLLQAWGSEDALVPQAAYQRFQVQALKRAAPYCGVRLSGADHGLQAPGRDGVRWLWDRLARWVHAPKQDGCSVFDESP